MKHVLEQQENLFLMQDEVVAIEQKDGAVSAIVTAVGVRHAVKAVVVASGTFLGGRVIIGEYTRESGPSRCAVWDCVCSASRPARRRASTAARLTLKAFRCRRERMKLSRFPSRPTIRLITARYVI